MIKKQQQFQATSLRKLLTTLMVIVILGAVGGFYLGLDYIGTYAEEVSHATTDASASEEKVEQLKELKGTLAQIRTSVAKADMIYSSDATYQAQAVKDLQKYAATAGISITNTDFAQPEPVAPDSRNVKISLAQPVSYESLIYFLELIEGSIPKMQVQGITVHRPTQPDGDKVMVDDITIKVSIK